MFDTVIPAGWQDYAPDRPHSSDRWAASARGWLWDGKSTSSLGNYLDYGSDHYRSGHEWCVPDHCNCRSSQPGNIHCVVYLRSDSTGPCRTRYVETVEQAHEWIEAVAGYSSEAMAALYAEAT